jgi:hypothetical protein
MNSIIVNRHLMCYVKRGEMVGVCSMHYVDGKYVKNLENI